MLASATSRGISRFHDSSSMTADISLLASSFPPHLFHPCKIAPLSLFLYLYLYFCLSLSLQTLQSAPWYYLSLLERGTHTIRAHARADLQYRGIIHDSLYDSTLSLLFLPLSLSRPLIFLSFNPGALGLCNFSPRGVIIHSRHRRREKMPRPLSLIRKHDSKEGRMESLAVTHSFVVQQHVVHNTRCNVLFSFSFSLLSLLCL